MITVIDYGAGNLKSVYKAVRFLGHDCEITGDINKIKNAEKLILPGVGSFGAAIERLNESGIADVIKNTEVPLLGICLGLQLLFDYSEESGCEGLGILNGKIVRIPDFGLKIPQIGWNSIEIKNAGIFSDVEFGSYVYFVHSYYAEPEDNGIVTATTEYGRRLCVAVSHNNINAVQFHPEKSGETGLKILNNFCKGAL